MQEDVSMCSADVLILRDYIAPCPVRAYECHGHQTEKRSRCSWRMRESSGERVECEHGGLFVGADFKLGDSQGLGIIVNAFSES